MSESKFIWVPNPHPHEWDYLAKNSPQGTLFCERLYLDLAKVTYNLYLIKQGIQTKGGVIVILGDNKKACRLDDLVIHNGLLFLPDPQKKAVRQRFEQFELTEFAINQLSNQFDIIDLAMAPQFEDLRPFSWYRYHDPDVSARFTLDLRYTLYLDVAELATNTQIESSSTFRALDTLRQRHIRQALKQGSVVRQGRNSQLLITYYRELMVRQGEHILQDKLNRIGSVVDGLVAAGRGAIYEVLNAAGIVVYIVTYGWDTKRAYYLFGAGHSEVNESWQGTFAHWEAFRDLAKTHRIKEADMEGVNSPQRGWFKMGFGGDLRPYYRVYKGMSV